MRSHDSGPWQASKIVPPRRRFMTADNYFKTPARIKQAPRQSTLWTIQNTKAINISKENKGKFTS